MAEQATVHEAEAEHAARRSSVPDAAGFFGKYGGQYLPPQLEAPFAEIGRFSSTLAAGDKDMDYVIEHWGTGDDG